MDRVKMATVNIKIISVLSGILVMFISIFSVYINKNVILSLILVLIYLYFAGRLPKKRIKWRYNILTFVFTVIILAAILNTSKYFNLGYITQCVFTFCSYIPVLNLQIVSFK